MPARSETKITQCLTACQQRGMPGPPGMGEWWLESHISVTQTGRLGLAREQGYFLSTRDIGGSVCGMLVTHVSDRVKGLQPGGVVHRRPTPRLPYAIFSALPLPGTSLGTWDPGTYR